MQLAVVAVAVAAAEVAAAAEAYPAVASRPRHYHLLALACSVETWPGTDCSGFVLVAAD